MLNDKDYAALPLEALLAEEKDVKKNQLFSAVAIGFLVGVMVYGFVNKGFRFFSLAIPLVLIAGIYKNSHVQKQNLEQIRAEIELRKIV